MLSLRKMVAGPKIRTIENGYNLDLSYITNRVIAMAYPAQGFQKLYRNSLNDVSSYLNLKHPSHYLVFNLSGRKYSYQKFSNQVQDYNWEDHQAPTLFTIFQIVEKMKKYLEDDGRNVVVVHCNHGKGRTGTIIVCLLLYCNFFDSPEEALEFYAKRRFQKQGYGVTQPCQLRYIYYFYSLLRTKTIKIRAYTLREISFKNTKIQSCTCTVSNVHTKKKITKLTSPTPNLLLPSERHLLLGDIFLDFRIPSVLNIVQKSFARVNMNTIFIPPDMRVRLRVEGISPDNLREKWGGVVGEDFEMEMVFEEYCGCDLTVRREGEVCECLEEIRGSRERWKEMYEVVSGFEGRGQEEGVRLLYGDSSTSGGEWEEEGQELGGKRKTKSKSKPKKESLALGRRNTP